VFALTVNEFAAEKLPCFEDPICASESAKANPAHAVADFSCYTESQQEKIAKKLKQCTVIRGRQHP
jgi:hypothetical protein